MKRILKWLGIGVAALVAIVVVGGFLMPSTVQVSRDITINAPAEKVFPHVANLKAFTKWSPWADIDPDMTQEFSGPEEGVGQKVSWSSDHDNVGTGSQEITEIIENQKVVSALDFGSMGTAQAQFDLAAEGEGTKVTWSLDTDLGNNPIARWFGPMIKSGVTEQYDKGLAKLKTVVESE